MFLHSVQQHETNQRIEGKWYDDMPPLEVLAGENEREVRFVPIDRGLNVHMQSYRGKN